MLRYCASLPPTPLFPIVYDGAAPREGGNWCLANRPSSPPLSCGCSSSSKLEYRLPFPPAAVVCACTPLNPSLPPPPPPPSPLSPLYTHRGSTSSQAFTQSTSFLPAGRPTLPLDFVTQPACLSYWYGIDLCRPSPPRSWCLRWIADPYLLQHAHLTTTAHELSPLLHSKLPALSLPRRGWLAPSPLAPWAVYVLLLLLVDGWALAALPPPLLRLMPPLPVAC